MAQTPTLYRLLPAALRGRQVREPGPGLAEVVRRGLPTALVDRLVRAGILTTAEIDRLVLPRRTLTHRRERGQALSPAESDRLARVLRILALAEETFQNSEKAHRWLRTANRELQGRTPLDLLDTDGGVHAVEAVLGRISHGVYG
jgi:putative toxin-antitoxin system antitoxin component (TIGR02293 family)